METRRYNWIFIALMTLLATVSCQEQKKDTVATALQMEQNDSLESIIAQRDNEINDMMATMNQIQDGFNKISEAEGRVSLAKDGEGVDRSQQIREDIKFIADRMQLNRELIKKLQGQLRRSDFRGDEMKKTITAMLQQLDQKDQQLQQLREQLDAKDIHIGELDETISNLNTSVSDLKTESEEKTTTINSQETQLNTAWFVFGTKRELRDQHILVDGKVLQQNFNKSYFTKIDIRVTREVNLYSKWAKLLTMHPSSSYELQRDRSQQYVLRITNPQLFWSTSKYLVVLVK